MPPRLPFLLVAAGVLGLACVGPAANAPTARDIGHGPPTEAPLTGWLVVAPHPDDEALIAAGTLARAVESGQRVAVVVLTNGDYDCVVDGLTREAESIAGLAAVGVDESNVTFLGYPDGALASLGRTPLPPVRRKIGGTCAEGSTTYASRGNKRGHAHPYTRADAVNDLTQVLDELRPADIIVTHPADTHPDHAATYAILRDALDARTFAPRVHRAIVHNGDCWPNGVEPKEPCADTRIDPRAPTMPLTGRLAGYVPGERLPVPESCLLLDPAQNKKLRAIAAHASQTRGKSDSYLFGFARADETFFPETLVRDASFLHRLGEKRLPSPGPYGLELDAAHREARLVRTSPGASPNPLATWPLPHDAFAGGPPTPEMFITGPEGGVVEISARLHGRLLGVAIDLSAFPSARRER